MLLHRDSFKASAVLSHKRIRKMMTFHDYTLLSILYFICF